MVRESASAGARMFLMYAYPLGSNTAKSRLEWRMRRLAASAAPCTRVCIVLGSGTKTGNGELGPGPGTTHARRVVRTTHITVC